MTKKNIAYYMSLAYPIVLTELPDDDGYDAEIKLLKGCSAYGETPEQALAEVVGVKEAWFEIAFERGWSIPEPETLDKEYSGRFNIRLPKYLHRKLSELAAEEGTSLNQFVVSLLSAGAERLEVIKTLEEPRSSTKLADDLLQAVTSGALASNNTEYSNIDSEAAYINPKVGFVVTGD